MQLINRRERLFIVNCKFKNIDDDEKSGKINVGDVLHGLVVSPSTFLARLPVWVSRLMRFSLT